MRIVRAFLSGIGGATSIEYATIAGLISLSIILGATAIGTKLNAHYTSPIAGGLS